MDIKPDNLMIDQDENLVIIDFSVSLQTGKYRTSRFPKGSSWFLLLLIPFKRRKPKTKHKNSRPWNPWIHCPRGV